MDISGYFMSINRQKLLEIVERRLEKMRYHYISNADTETSPTRRFAAYTAGCHASSKGAAPTS